MKTALIITLGNRDLQIKKEKFNLVPGKIQQYLEKNNDDENFFIIRKDNSKSFLDISKELNQSYNELRVLFDFPLINIALNEINNEANAKPDLFLFATAQENLDKQDCIYIAQIACKHFQEKGYLVSIIKIKQNPTNIPLLAEFFFGEFQKIKNNYQRLYIENAGGTPQIRTATHFAGLFQNYTYYNINARNKKVEVVSFQALEKLVLKEICENMLKVHDYEGIRQIPVSDEIKQKAGEALKLYNLEDSIKGNNYIERSIRAINLLIENLKVCYIQGRYADVVGRLFRIEEAVWYALFYKLLKDSGCIVDKDKVAWKNEDGKSERKNFNELISNNDARRSFLKANYSDQFEECNGNLYFKNEEFKKVPTNSGKNFYWYFFKSINKFNGFTEFFSAINKNKKGEPYKSDSILNQVRNKSYLGHGFEGVGEKDIKNILGKDLNAFTYDLINLLKNEFADFQYEEVFTQKTEEIKRLITNG